MSGRRIGRVFPAKYEKNAMTCQLRIGFLSAVALVIAIFAQSFASAVELTNLDGL